MRKVWRLETDRGVFCLKKTILSRRELLFVKTALDHLSGHGFTAVLPMLATAAGSSSTELAGSTYVLFPWRESREADFGRREDLDLAARTLAQMHACTGFVPFLGDPARVRWGLWPQILAARRNQMVEFGLRALAGRDSSLFCARYARLHPYFLAEAGRALAALADSPYLSLSREGVGRRTICHHDCSARNLLIDRESRPTLVDFDYCLADLRLHDLANLMLRLLRHDHWRPATAIRVLELYDRHSSLDQRELAVLYPLMLWPQDFWQLGLQFFLERLPWSQERYLRALRHRNEEREERAAFLAWYEREFWRPRPLGIPLDPYGSGIAAGPWQFTATLSSGRDGIGRGFRPMKLDEPFFQDDLT